MTYRRNVPEGVNPGDPHPLRPHWTLMPPADGQDHSEDDWVREDGGVRGFSFCPDDEERVARLDEYDARHPIDTSGKNPCRNCGTAVYYPGRSVIECSCGALNRTV